MTHDPSDDPLSRARALIIAENGEAGGIGRYCVDIAAELKPLVQVACLCPRPCAGPDGCWLAGRCAEHDVVLHRVTMPARGWRSGFRGLLRLWQRTDRATLHVNGRRGNSIAVVGRLVFRSLRYVTSVHGVLGLHDRRNRVYRVVDLAAGRLAAAVIAVSDHGRSVLLAAGSPKSRTLAISNGLTRSDLRRLQRHEGDPARDPAGGPVRVGFLGRLSREKGTDELLVVARRLAMVPEIERIDIAGDGPERETLMRAAIDMIEPDRIRLLGTVEDPSTFLKDMDILVMPSHNEGLPYVLLEAMAAGCAVVAFSVGGITEVISDPRVGVLVGPGDVDALVDGIVSLARDRPRSIAMGLAASEHVDRAYRLETRLPALRRLYRIPDREADPAPSGSSTR